MQLEWHQHGFDLEIEITADGRLVSMFFYCPDKGINMEIESISCDDFLAELENIFNATFRVPSIDNINGEYRSIELAL